MNKTMALSIDRSQELYFHHDWFGLILLSSYDACEGKEENCNLCGTVVHPSGFQCVDSICQQRDGSAFEISRSGFDLCVRCAVAYHDNNMRKIKTWMKDGDDVLYLFRSHTVGAHTLTWGSSDLRGH